jgi:hypothetical protein
VISLLFLVPAALGVLVRLTPSRIPPEGLEFMLAMMLLPQLLIPLVALLYASGIIEDELEDQTITYLLIRPLPRWRSISSNCWQQSRSPSRSRSSSHGGHLRSYLHRLERCGERMDRAIG